LNSSLQSVSHSRHLLDLTEKIPHRKTLNTTSFIDSARQRRKTVRRQASPQHKRHQVIVSIRFSFATIFPSSGGEWPDEYHRGVHKLFSLFDYFEQQVSSAGFNFVSKVAHSRWVWERWRTVWPSPLLKLSVTLATSSMRTFFSVFHVVPGLTSTTHWTGVCDVLRVSANQNKDSLAVTSQTDYLQSIAWQYCVDLLIASQ